MQHNEIVTVYGSRPEQMVGPLLDYMGVTDGLRRDTLIGIKPNLVLAKPSSSGATTDPEIVSGVIRYLRSHGFANVVILESSWVGCSTSKAFRSCGYQELSRRSGTPLIDLKRRPSVPVRVLDTTINVSSDALKVEYLINIPVLKAHCQTGLTCALKNLKGCVPDAEKRRFHSLELHKPIACLNKALGSDLVIVDGIVGDLTFEEGGTPVQMNRILGAKDAVLVDAYATTLIGYRPDEIPYIGLAQELDIGSADLSSATITELNRPSGRRQDALDTDDCNTTPDRLGSGRLQKSDDPLASHTYRCIAGPLAGAASSGARTLARLSSHVMDKQACSPCLGSLLHALQRLSERGLLPRLTQRICVGQGFQSQTGKGVGVGSCARGLEHSLDGCPPTAEHIVQFLWKLVSQ